MNRSIYIGLCVLFTGGLFSIPIFAESVFINELMSSNSSTLYDEDGDDSDWIELYNGGVEAVNLAGWGLSDDEENPFRWVFPPYVMEPGEHLLVWASGKDRRPDGTEHISGIRREVWLDITGTSLSNLLNYADYPASPDSSSQITTVFEAPTNVADNYGQRMHGYLLAPVTGSYIFWISGDDNSQLFLSTDENPANVELIAEVTGWTNPREWGKFSSQASSSVTLQAGQYYYISALMKEGTGGDNLSVRWQLPDGTMEEPIPASRIFFGQGQLHTNFSISADGEELFLTRPDGTVADQAAAAALIGDVSYGRSTDGGASWVFFEQSTPGTRNDASVGYLGIMPMPEFSHAGGTYADPIALTLSTSDPAAQIYYTLDGSAPDANNLSGTSYEYRNQYPSGPLLTRQYRSYLYEEALSIDEGAASIPGLSSINTQNSAGGGANATWTIDGNELVQNSTATNVRLFFGDTGWGDYEMTLQAQKTGGNEGFVVICRAPSNNNFYWFNIGGWNNTRHAIEKEVNGSRTVVTPNLAGSVNTGQWYNIRVRCEGNNFKLWLDPNQIFDYTDTNAPHLSGGVGVGTWATQARFRNIEVRTLEGDLLYSGLPSLPILPSVDQMPAIVVRARAHQEGYIPSPVATHTYFVGPTAAGKHSLPVVSLAVEEPDFFSYLSGIYVAGVNYTNTGNFWMRGDSWERPVHISFFEPDGTLGFTQDLGARIHGGWTRNLPQKALRLYARGGYGETEISYPVFPNLTTDVFKRLLLRNSGNDWGQTMFRDGMMQRLVEHLPLDTQAFRPAVLYINGEYWGINNLRERYDKYYLEGKYGVDPDRVDILEYLPGSVHLAKEGDTTHFDETLAYIETNGLVDAAHYQAIQTRIDTENFMLYQVSQIYFGNTDWPGNNNDWWRLRTDSYEPTAPYGHDGRWRWMLYDTDFGFNLATSASHDTLAFAMDANPNNTGWPNPHWTTYLFRKLLENETFKRDFVNRYADLLNTALLPARVVSVIDEMAGEIAPEMNRHVQRWGSPGSYSSWQGSVNTMRSFGQQRPAYARDHLRTRFSLGPDILLTLNVSDAAHGHVRLNNTDITASTPGVNPSAVYPWSGTYFQDTPVSVKAVPQSGYRFVHWQTSEGQTEPNQVLTLPMSAATSITAYFEELPDPHLLHYWSFNDATDVSGLLTPFFTLGSAQMAVEPNDLTEVTSGTGQDFANVNGRLGEPVGSHLRINYPIGAAIVVSVPTTHYEDIIVRYESRRSNSGAGQQMISYSIDGSTFTPWQTIVLDTVPVLYTFDFSELPAVDNNPQFKLKIEFAAGIGGVEGNDRFDNLTVEGFPQEGTNPPPNIIRTISLQEMIEQSQTQIDLSAYFLDSDPLTYTAAADKPFVATGSLSGSVLTLEALAKGDAIITVGADDGVNPPVQMNFRILVYPQAKPVRLGLSRFNYWSADEPEHGFPDNFLFLQSDVSDPGLAAALEYAYFIPHSDYAASDAGVIGFPYKTTSRTRINGLDANGISFINTGRGRDLGGALTAIDTRGLDGVRVSWLAGTVVQNSRICAVRLQYRIGHTGPFADVLDNAVPFEYQVQTNGHTQMMGPVELPAEAVNQPYVQLLWRYYYISGSGARPQLRLDDIAISGVSAILEDVSLFAQWWLRADCAQTDHCGGADLTFDGRVDLDDFASLAAQWLNENTFF